MRSPLVVAVAQPACLAHDVAANARAHAALVRQAHARVVVFPELSLTGYELDADPVGDDDPRLAPLVDACAATGALALAGAPVAGPGGKHIGVLAVDGDGARVAYRKMYLGGDEPAWFDPGPAPGIVEVDGWRLGLAVCKDTGVPEHAAATAAAGIDAYLAGVADRSGNVAVIEERARRIATDPRRVGGGGQLRRLDRRRLRPGGGQFGRLGARWPRGAAGAAPRWARWPAPRWPDGTRR